MNKTEEVLHLTKLPSLSVSVSVSVRVCVRVCVKDKGEEGLRRKDKQTNNRARQFQILVSAVKKKKKKE